MCVECLPELRVPNQYGDCFHQCAYVLCRYECVVFVNGDLLLGNSTQRNLYAVYLNELNHRADIIFCPRSLSTRTRNMCLPFMQ